MWLSPDITTFIPLFTSVGIIISNSHVLSFLFLTLTLLFMMAENCSKRRTLLQNKSKKIKKNYYAVIGSHKSGIYTSYNEANKFVKGVSGASLVGRETLKEAKMDLISCGYPDPKIYDFRRSETGSDQDHSDDEMRSSVSDSESQIDVYAIDDDTLFDLPDENRVLTLDQNLGGMSCQPALRSSSSDSYQPSASAMIKEIRVPDRTETLGLDDSGEITLNQTGMNRSLDKLSHETSVKEVYREPSSTSSASENTSSNESTTFAAVNFESLLKSSIEHLLRVTNDAFDCIKCEVKSLRSEVQEQKDLTSKVRVEMGEIHKENQLLSFNIKKEIQAVKDTLANSQNMDLIDQANAKSDAEMSFSSIQATENLITKRCDEIAKESSDLKKKLDISLSTNEKLIKDVEHITLITQQLVLKVENQSDELKTSNSNQMKMMESQSNHDVLNKQLILCIEKQNEKLDSLKTPTPPLSVNDKSDESVHKAETAELTKGKVGDVEERVYSDNEHEILFHHPSFKKFSLTPPNIPSSKLPYLRLPDSCSNVLIGDSNIQSVNKKSLDPNGATEVRTFRGSSFRKVCDILSSTDNTFPNIKTVTFCLGSVDCNKNYINIEQIIHDAEQLISVSKQVFPAASISIINIPPQSNPKSNFFIKSVNRKLGYHLPKLSVHFVKSEDLWRHVDDKGIPVSGMVLGRSQLSDAAVYILMQSVKNFFSKIRVSKNLYSDNKTLQKQFHGDLAAQTQSPDLALSNDSHPCPPLPLSTDTYTPGTSSPQLDSQHNNSMTPSSQQYPTASIRSTQHALTSALSSTPSLPHYAPASFGISRNHVLPNETNHGVSTQLQHLSRIPFPPMPVTQFNPRFSNLHPMLHNPFFNMQFAMNSLSNPYSMGNVPLTHGLNPHTYLSSSGSAPATNYAQSEEHINNNAQINPAYQRIDDQ